MYLLTIIRRILGRDEMPAVISRQPAPRGLTATHQVLRDAANILRERQPQVAGMSVAPDKFPEPQPKLPPRDPREMDDLLSADDLVSAIEDISPAFSNEWRAFAAAQPAASLHDRLTRYAAHVLALVKNDREAELAKVFDMVERMIIFGDDEVLGTISVSFLESLHNLASWEPLGTNLVRTYLLTASWRVWRLIAWLYRGGCGAEEICGTESRLVADAVRAIALHSYGREKVARRIEASLRAVGQEHAELSLTAVG